MNAKTSAELAISRARAALVLDEPWFGTLALRLKPTPVTDAEWRAKAPAGFAPTMAVDGKSLFYYPPFVESQKPEHLKFIVAHETLHLASRHHCRRGSRDGKRWNIACLAWGTPIRLYDGTDVPIQRIMPGDMLASPLGKNRVLATVFAGWRDTYLLEFGGQPIAATGEHRFGTAEGWKDAEAISHAACNGYIIDKRGGASVHSGKSSGTVSPTTEQSDGSSLCDDFPIPTEARTISEQVFFQAARFTNPRIDAGTRNSVLCWTGGRRGDYIRSTQQGRTLAALSLHQQHILPAYAMAEITRAIGGAREKRLRQLVLSDRGFWIPDRDAYSQVTALACCQASARARLAASYQCTETATLSIARQGRSGQRGNACDHPAIEQTRGEVRARARQRIPVFELVTEAGSYFASGVLTHNCDFAIDPLLVKAGFVAPPAAHLDPQYAGMAAEQIYARLPQPQQGGNGGNGQPGANGGPVDEEGAPGGVWDAPAGDGAPAPSPADLRAAEEEWKAAVLQATQAAKAAGKLPGFAREFAAQIRAPQIDWREQLRFFMSQAARSDYSWRKPNVRFLAAGDYLPSLYSESMGPVALFRDTSGSVGHAEHAALMAEANAIAEEVKPERVYLGSFHTRVYQMDEFEQGEPIKPSRTENGGTLFAPIWQAVDELEVPPVCVVVLTDLLPADQWGAEPAYPVLFVATTNNTAPWGTTVRLSL